MQRKKVYNFISNKSVKLRKISCAAENMCFWTLLSNPSLVRSCWQFACVVSSLLHAWTGSLWEHQYVIGQHSASIQTYLGKKKDQLVVKVTKGRHILKDQAWLKTNWKWIQLETISEKHQWYQEILIFKVFMLHHSRIMMRKFL